MVDWRKTTKTRYEHLSHRPAQVVQHVHIVDEDKHVSPNAPFTLPAPRAPAFCVLWGLSRHKGLDLADRPVSRRNIPSFRKPDQPCSDVHRHPNGNGACRWPMNMPKNRDVLFAVMFAVSIHQQAVLDQTLSLRRWESGGVRVGLPLTRLLRSRRDHPAARCAFSDKRTACNDGQRVCLQDWPFPSRCLFKHEAETLPVRSTSIQSRTADGSQDKRLQEVLNTRPKVLEDSVVLDDGQALRA